MNLVILRGRLGRDPETSYTANGTAITRFSLATSKRYTDRMGQKQEKTEWHRVVVWDKLAEIAAQYLSKGREALITGELQTRQYQDKDGQPRTVTEVHARDLELIGGRAGGESAEEGAGPMPPGGQTRPAPAAPAPPPRGYADAYVAGRDSDDDIPF